MSEVWVTIRNRAGLSWLVLIVATAASFVLGIEASDAPWAGCLILLIAILKVRLVGLDFMRLRTAPWPLRAAFEAYCATLLAVLTALYLVAA